ncbi:MAG: hypothetical protein J6W37_00905 [Bacteroidales bacterium]|nr:hypothetical protein [Bacteroidales bacterium]
MVIEFISPFIEGAFSEPILHRVVLSKIDFELCDEDWEEIESGFAYYWDEEAGLGNYVDAESAFFSIRNNFLTKRILFPDNRLWTIVEAIFDFIEQIPGVILCDDEIPMDIDEQSDTNTDQKAFIEVYDKEKIFRAFGHDYDEDFARVFLQSDDDEENICPF